MSEGPPFDEAVFFEVLGHLKRGLNRKYACHAAGTSDRVLRYWKAANHDLEFDLLKAEAGFFLAVVPTEDQIGQMGMRDRIALMKLLSDRESKTPFTEEQRDEMAKLTLREKRAEVERVEANRDIAQARAKIAGIIGEDDWETFAARLRAEGGTVPDVLPAPKRRKPSANRPMRKAKKA